MKINTDPQKIQELLTRGVENIYPNREFLDKELKSGRQLTLYVGYDPTAATLHIGNGITLLKLRQFQDLGHKIIMLIGDFTGMIGDPTDKTSTRQPLTRKQVLENCKNYKKQASAIISFSGSNQAEIKYNSKWLAKMNLGDFLGLAAKFTVPRLMERDMFQERLKEGKTVCLHELVYPVLQAYDSFAMDVDGEVGGNDQTFNMLCGRDLMKEMKNREKFVLTAKILEDTTGKKMGKSEGNMIAMNDTPTDMYGKVMRWSDGMILGGFELCTRIDIPSEAEIQKEPMKYKKLLAFEITKTFLGEKAAIEGQKSFESIFQEREKPVEMPEIKPSAYDVITVLMESGICTSKGDARRQIEQGGVKVNDVKISDFAYQTKPGEVVQKGSRFFVRVI